MLVCGPVHRVVRRPGPYWGSMGRGSVFSGYPPNEHNLGMILIDLLKSLSLFLAKLSFNRYPSENNLNKVA